jgi:hypothetical protein
MPFRRRSGYLKIDREWIGQERPNLGLKDTPLLPGGQWHVHDGDRPLPPCITPGTSSAQDEPGRPLSDAVILFDGKDLSHWHGYLGKLPGGKIEEGSLVVVPNTGEIISKDEFGERSTSARQLADAIP